MSEQIRRKDSFEIVPLPREKWKGTPIPMRYSTTEYMDVAIERTEEGFLVKMGKSPSRSQLHILRRSMTSRTGCIRSIGRKRTHGGSGWRGDGCLY